ncbi:MAG: polyketide antibiotic transporter, partial [Nostocoides sp.]
SEEAQGRAEVVLATATTRWHWLGSHVVVALGGSTLLMVVVGAAAGVGASRSDVIGLAALLAAAVSTLPAVWVCAAVAVTLFGLLPRRTGATWAVLAVFVLLGELGALLKLPHWVQGISPFAHLGSLPGGPADLLGAGVLLVVAGALAAYGAVSFRRRDLTT